MTENKTERIFIRVSPTEKKEIEEKAKLARACLKNKDCTKAEKEVS